MLGGAAGAAGSCAVNEKRQNDERAKSNFSIRVFSSCIVVREYMPEVVPWGSFIVWAVLMHNIYGNTGKEREKAGSLAALGMTNQKGKCKNNSEGHRNGRTSHQKSLNFCRNDVENPTGAPTYQ